jgi:hypothetical protein
MAVNHVFRIVQVATGLRDVRKSSNHSTGISHSVACGQSFRLGFIKTDFINATAGSIRSMDLLYARRRLARRLREPLATTTSGCTRTRKGEIGFSCQRATSPTLVALLFQQYRSPAKSSAIIHPVYRETMYPKCRVQAFAKTQGRLSVALPDRPAC